jgi:uncharacterized membrane protein YjfL (UPF0719 family)
MELLNNYLSVTEAFAYLSFDALIYLVVVMVLLWVGKLVNDLLTPYRIGKVLLEQDNKALAVSFSGYLLALAVIILGVLTGPERNLRQDLVATGIWGAVGIVLLNIARLINDKVILHRFNNVKEILEDRNVGTGAVEFGSYVGAAFIVRAIVAGESQGLAADTIGTIVFFVAGQIAFVLFGLAYQVITSYDIHEQIEKDNVAAGIAFGMTLAAMGIVLSHIIVRTDSLAAFGVWFVNGAALVLLARFLVDKLILPSHRLDDEIARDRNWGVALIEGGAAIAVAFLINASFA